MQPLFWNKVPRTGLASSVWGEIEGSGIEPLDLGDLAAEFAVAPVSVAGGGAQGAAKAGQKKAPDTLLGMQRANNVGEWQMLACGRGRVG